jgi:peptidoglycan-N-acetylglucosamine deacetylase
MMKPTIALILVCLLAGPTWAAGPESVALSDRSLWPDTIDSPAGFDRASRAEILVFAAALSEATDRNEDTLKAELRIRSVDMGSLTRVRNRLLDNLVANYRNASKQCSTAAEPFCAAIGSSESLTEAGKALPRTLPERYRSWLDNAQAFHRGYANELIRLAALFPKVTSEIDTFTSSERSGAELADKHFLLTFDDGPSNDKGNTDRLVKVLDQHRLNGLFFVLGERLKARSQAGNGVALPELYKGQCVALHGWQHQSHQKWDQWQTSVLDSQRLVKDVLPQNYRPYFRPPYGQRRSDSESFFHENGLTVSFWNIDSQDWNTRVTGDEVKQRVFTLMLLWRRGVILFHDIHTKAQTALPWLVAQTSSSGITWDDCHNY